MATGAKIGRKAQFLREDTVGGGTYTAIAEIKSISGPNVARDAVEATSNDSSDDFAEFIPGIADAGEVTLTLNARPDNATHGAASGLAYDADNGTARAYQVKFPQFNAVSPPTLTFTAFCTGFEITSETRSVVTCVAKFKITGKPTRTNWPS